MKDTAVVEAMYYVTHRLYSKRVSRTKKYHADNKIGAVMGNMVELVETRPISKTKNWRVTKVLNPNATT